jgi:hypothetical protein
VLLDPVPDVIALCMVAGSQNDGIPYLTNHFIYSKLYASIFSFRLIISYPANPGDVIAFHFQMLRAAPMGTLNHHHGVSGRQVISFHYLGDAVGHIRG